MLLLGFIVLVAGVAVWLVLTSPETDLDPDPDPDKTATMTAPKQIPKEIPKETPKAAAKTETPPADKALATHGAEPEPGGAEKTSQAHKAAPHSSAAAPDTAHTPATPPSAPPHGTAPSHGADTTAAKPAAAPPAKASAKQLSRQPAAPQKTSKRAIVPKKLPPVPRDAPLSPSPDPALVQVTALGPLPRIGADGRLPRRVYAKPFDLADKRPRAAIVVTGLGLSAAATESAIQGLPGSVTLAFAPYSARLNEWIRLARAAGHEVMINVPMEPTNYPAYDPGPQTLLTSLNAEGNLDRLLWSLSRGTGYVGVVDFLGSRFTTSRKHMRPVLKAINDRGLLYLDSGSSPRSVSPIVANDVKISWAMATLTLDQRASRTEIDRKFSELEQRAKRDKRAIGIASPYPVSLERIATWVRQLEARGIAIAPVSALVRTGAATKKK